MMKLIERFSCLVKSTISGFDRIVFKGFVLPLMSADNVMHFCRAQGILNKDYKSWMMAQTKNIIDHADQYAKDHCGHGVIHIPTWRTRKDALAHERQQQEHLASGLIGVCSCQPPWRISGLTNKMLCEYFSGKSLAKQRTEKQLSAKISRHLRLLRAHGLIRKLPKQNRYQLTLKGTKLTNVLNAFLAASTENLMKMAA